MSNIIEVRTEYLDRVTYERDEIYLEGKVYLDMDRIRRSAAFQYGINFWLSEDLYTQVYYNYSNDEMEDVIYELGSLAEIKFLRGASGVVVHGQSDEQQITLPGLESNSHQISFQF